MNIRTARTGPVTETLSRTEKQEYELHASKSPKRAVLS